MYLSERKTVSLPKRKRAKSTSKPKRKKEKLTDVPKRKTFKKTSVNRSSKRVVYLTERKTVSLPQQKVLPGFGNGEISPYLR